MSQEVQAEAEAGPGSSILEEEIEVALAKKKQVDSGLPVVEVSLNLKELPVPE